MEQVAVMRNRLHVIVPARNEVQNVPFFYERVRAAFEALSDVDWSVVFVNNASEDGTLERVLQLRESDARVKVITLSRDFGYHGGLVAGLSSVESDYYAIVDVDCEDPPELLVDFFRALQQEKGPEIAYGVRSKRDEPWLITFGRKLFYIANRRVADSEIVMWMGEFSMFTKQVRDAVLATKTTFVSIRAEMGYVGFPRVGLPYQRAKRTYGQTHYNLWRMTVYAILSILSGTTFPLRLVSYVAVLVGVAFPIVVLSMDLTASEVMVSAAVTLLYYLVITIPLISLYLARTYKNVAARPVFVIDQTRTHL
jgi:glycosyltransferase involved in cell wall biosynthesis